MDFHNFSCRSFSLERQVMFEIPSEMKKKELFTAQSIFPTIREVAALLRLKHANTGGPVLQA
jgi:hypothetical protein